MQISNIKPVFSGICLAFLTCLSAYFLPKETAFIILNVLLVIIALVYLGFAFADKNPKNLLIELGGILIFIAIAFAGWQFSPKFLAFGYFAHGIWDALHHPKALQTKVWSWYPPFCLIYDWIVAIFILIWFQ